MPLPTPVAIKFDLYTLACHHLLARLGALHDAAQRDTRLDEAFCVRLFDDVLQRFFVRAAPHSLRQACGQFGAMLRADVDVVRPRNTRVARVFDELIELMHAQVTTWQPRADLDRFHRIGRDLARRFFAPSPWPVTQQRLKRICDLLIDYGTTDEGRIGPADDRVAPAAYRQRRWDAKQSKLQTQVVLVRFDFRHTFASYLSYPFLFLHEYTAHVYATDWENDIFNDGWLLYAADAFLTREWNRDAGTIELDREQVKIFQNYWYPAQLNPLPLRGCNLARDLDSWLSAVLPERFADLTYELAAFQPRTGESPLLPTQVVYALERAFRSDRRRLLAVLQTAPNIQDLPRLLRLL